MMTLVRAEILHFSSDVSDFQGGVLPGGLLGHRTSKYLYLTVSYCEQVYRFRSQDNGYRTIGDARV